MRGVFIIIVIVAVLIGAGVLHVTWKDGTASVKFDKEKAHERTEQVLEEARTLEANFEKSVHQQK